jgi:hypothetical protein
MKIKLVLVSLALCALSSLVLARNLSYNRQRPPRLSLGEAFPLAMHALGADTNQFYCLRANVAIIRSPDGEWIFDFENTNGVEKDVDVFFDKTAQVVDLRVITDNAP